MELVNDENPTLDLIKVENFESGIKIEPVMEPVIFEKPTLDLIKVEKFESNIKIEPVMELVNVENVTLDLNKVKKFESDIKIEPAMEPVIFENPTLDIKVEKFDSDIKIEPLMELVNVENVTLDLIKVEQFESDLKIEPVMEPVIFENPTLDIKVEKFKSDIKIEPVMEVGNDETPTLGLIKVDNFESDVKIEPDMELANFEIDTSELVVENFELDTESENMKRCTSGKAKLVSEEYMLVQCNDEADNNASQEKEWENESGHRSIVEKEPGCSIITEQMSTILNKHEVYSCQYCKYETKFKKDLLKHISSMAHSDMEVCLIGETSGESEDSELNAMVFCDQEHVSENCPVPRPNKNGVGMRGHFTELHHKFSKPSNESGQIVGGAKEAEDCKSLGSESDILERNLATGAKYKRKEVTSLIDSVSEYHCPVCSFETNLRHIFKHHVKIHRKPGLTEAIKESATVVEGRKCFRCRICELVTKSRHRMKLHLLSVSHTVKSGELQKGSDLDSLWARTYCCHLCPFQTHRKALIRAHVESHSDDSDKGEGHKVRRDKTGDRSAQMRIQTRLKFRCSECSFETDTSRSIPGHMKTHRLWQKACKATVFRCQTCEHWSHKVGDIKRHLVGHADLGGSVVFEGRPEFRCEKCPFRTVLRWFFHRHRHKCCQNKGKRPTKHKQKVRNVGKISRTGRCGAKKQSEIVGMAVSQDDSLPQILQCEDCSCRFVSEYLLMTHVKACHMSGTNWLMCDMCVYVTKRVDKLNAHVETMHCTKPPEHRSDPVQSPDLGALRCPEKILIGTLQCPKKDESKMVRSPGKDESGTFQCSENDESQMVWCSEKNVTNTLQCPEKDESQMVQSPEKDESRKFQCPKKNESQMVRSLEKNVSGIFDCPKKDEIRLVWCPEKNVISMSQCPERDKSQMVQIPGKDESKALQCRQKNESQVLGSPGVDESGMLQCPKKDGIQMLGCLKDESQMVQCSEKDVNGTVCCFKSGGTAVGPGLLSQIETSVGTIGSIELKNDQSHGKHSLSPHAVERKVEIVKREEPDCIDLTDEKMDIYIKSKPIDPCESVCPCDLSIKDEDFERKVVIVKREEPDCIDLTDEKMEIDIKSEPMDPCDSVKESSNLETVKVDKITLNNSNAGNESVPQEAGIKEDVSEREGDGKEMREQKGAFHCVTCPYSTTDRELIMKHLSRHFIRPEKTVERPKLVMATVDGVKTYSSIIGGINTYLCSKCPYTAIQLNSMLAHTREHICYRRRKRPYLQIFQCPCCPCRFTQVEILTKHINTRHPKSDTFNGSGADKEQTKRSVLLKTQLAPNGSFITRQMVINHGTVSGNTSPAKMDPQKLSWLLAATQEKLLKRPKEKAPKTGIGSLRRIAPLPAPTSNKPEESPSAGLEPETGIGSFPAMALLPLATTNKQSERPSARLAPETGIGSFQGIAPLPSATSNKPSERPSARLAPETGIVSFQKIAPLQAATSNKPSERPSVGLAPMTGIDSFQGIAPLPTATNSKPSERPSAGLAPKTGIGSFPGISPLPLATSNKPSERPSAGLAPKTGIASLQRIAPLEAATSNKPSERPNVGLAPMTGIVSFPRILLLQAATSNKPSERPSAGLTPNTGMANFQGPVQSQGACSRPLEQKNKGSTPKIVTVPKNESLLLRPKAALNIPPGSFRRIAPLPAATSNKPVNVLAGSSTNSVSSQSQICFPSVPTNMAALSSGNAISSLNSSNQSAHGHVLCANTEGAMNSENVTCMSNQNVSVQGQFSCSLLTENKDTKSGIELYNVAQNMNQDQVLSQTIQVPSVQGAANIGNTISQMTSQNWSMQNQIVNGFGTANSGNVLSPFPMQNQSNQSQMLCFPAADFSNAMLVESQIQGQTFCPAVHTNNSATNLGNVSSQFPMQNQSKQGQMLCFPAGNFSNVMLVESQTQGQTFCPAIPINNSAKNSGNTLRPAVNQNIAAQGQNFCSPIPNVVATSMGNTFMGPFAGTQSLTALPQTNSANTLLVLSPFQM